MSIIKSTIVNNFESLVIIFGACYSSIKHHKLKSGAEGEEEIGDSQEPLRIGDSQEPLRIGDSEPLRIGDSQEPLRIIL